MPDLRLADREVTAPTVRLEEVRMNSTAPRTSPQLEGTSGNATPLSDRVWGLHIFISPWAGIVLLAAISVATAIMFWPSDIPIDRVRTLIDAVSN